MPIPVSIPDYIEVGDISQFLAADDQNNFVRYPGGTIMPELSFLIWYVRTGIEWAYEVDPTDTRLTKALFYLKKLIGKYSAQAQRVMGNGVGVIVVPGASGMFTSIREQVVVGAVDSPLQDGTTVWVLDYPRAIYNTIEVSMDGTELLQGLADRLSYTLTIQATTFTITFNQAPPLDAVVVVDGWYLT